MARQKWRLHWGLVRGLSLTQLYLISCAITYLTKTKIKDNDHDKVTAREIYAKDPQGQSMQKLRIVTK